MLNKMKSLSMGKNTIILFFIMTAYLFSQGWNNTVTTTINEPNLVKMDLFTNKDGNHIIVQNSNSTNSIKYYLLNSSGTVVRSSTIETSGYAEFPNISGDNDKVYLVYKLGGYLKAKKSTDAGQNWNATTIQPLSIGSNTCNGVDIVYGDGGLHVVYAMKDSDPYYETYYYKLNSSNNWVDYKNVTDYENEVGGFPTVTFSTDRVHVSYNTGSGNDPETNTGNAKSRDKYLTTWQTPQLIYEPQSFREKVHTGNSKLYDFYYKLVSGDGQYHSDFYVKERSLTGSTWSSEILLNSFASVSNPVSAVTTADNYVHIIYPVSEGIAYRKNTGSSWNSETSIASDGWYSPLISSSSNDLFVIYYDYWNDQLRYRQYDAAPLAPQNVAVTSNGNNNPIITWTANKEADLSVY